MSTVDVLETEFNLKGNYEREAKKVQAATAGISSSLSKLNMASSIGRLASMMGTAAVAAIALGTALGGKAMHDSAQFDSLVKGLESVEGSAKEAQKQLAKLKEIARGPGIGFEESVQGYGGLRRAGMDQGLSERLVREAGNANAASGGGVAKFERIMLAFSQMALKPTLQGDELLQLNEAGLPVQKMLKDRYGTADGRELAKLGLSVEGVIRGLVEEMEKMPRVGGGFQNVLDNFGDTMKFASVEVGNGLNESLLPLLDEFTKGITEMTADGTLTNLGQSMGELVSKMSDAVGGADGLAHSLGNLVNGMANFGDFVGNTWDFVRQSPFLSPLASAADYLYGGDILREKGEADAFNAEMEKDPRIIAQREREKAREEQRAKDEAAKEEAKKQKRTPEATLLEKIEANTRVLPDIARAAWGGGELARIGVTPHEVKAARAERKIARDLRRYAQIVAVPTVRTSGR